MHKKKSAKRSFFDFIKDKNIPEDKARIETELIISQGVLYEMIEYVVRSKIPKIRMYALEYFLLVFINC